MLGPRLSGLLCITATPPRSIRAHLARSLVQTGPESCALAGLLLVRPSSRPNPPQASFSAEDAHVYRARNLRVNKSLSGLHGALLSSTLGGSFTSPIVKAPFGRPSWRRGTRHLCGALAFD